MLLTSSETALNDEADPLSIIVDQVNQCFSQADTFFGTRFKRSSCNFKQRGRAAGTAHLQKNELRFNYFMYLQDSVEFLSTVVPHEVAHIIVFQIYGNSVKPHGKEWQAVMFRVYGIRPSRTHTFDVPPQKHNYEYRCACQKHQFTKQRHTRAQRGTEYVCKKCRSSLQFMTP
ncbi:SprT family zinc-dependent metalloprotease [Marinomonas sp. M1K-6]|uniref:SprT family zinc-dependent metalloprotease n=1 Tax=Marinomonas profundi TaxID=2726122 RepID=A0A847R7Z9_9GAMM|nr:SprT family zinc-dependent metalloprotease [Marinomonas profundi]NLQ16400.1 SprT family zinc-dependent metalloprotease [Marinomonas profundi]UDV03027.1 SprT family zinc-dependent metalloprotease [Marinomonas profundi]